MWKECVRKRFREGMIHLPTVFSTVNGYRLGVVSCETRHYLIIATDRPGIIVNLCTTTTFINVMPKSLIAVESTFGKLSLSCGKVA